MIFASGLRLLACGLVLATSLGGATLRARVHGLDHAATTFELGLAHREHEQLGLDVGGVGAGDGEIEHGARARGQAQRKVAGAAIQARADG